MVVVAIVRDRNMTVGTAVAERVGTLYPYPPPFDGPCRALARTKHRRDDQLSAGEVDAIERALIGEPRHLLDFAVEARPAAGEIAFHVGVDRDRQWPLGLEQREGRLRNQVALEVLILAAAFDPDIAGAQPITKLEEDAQFIGLAIRRALHPRLRGLRRPPTRCCRPARSRMSCSKSTAGPDLLTASRISATAGRRTTSRPCSRRSWPTASIAWPTRFGASPIGSSRWFTTGISGRRAIGRLSLG